MADAPLADKQMRVLIADDNKDAADSLSWLLRLWGYEARVAYDGETAWQEAQTFAPDCVFLDIGLPGIDGYELARRLRQDARLKDIRLVALTAYADRDLSAKAGFDRHLVKPADLDQIKELLDMLKQVLQLANRTEQLSQQNVALARETKELIQDAKEELREVKEEIKEVKEEIKEVKECLEQQNKPHDDPAP